MAKHIKLCSTWKWTRGPCASCILMETLGGGRVVPTKIGPLGIKQETEGEGRVMTLYLLKIQRRLRFEKAERWSHVKQPPTPLRSQRGASIIHECRGLPFFLSTLISRLYLFPSHTKPFPFLPPSKISLVTQSWWELISRTASKVEVLHCPGSLILTLGLCIWAENQHKPPSTFQYNGRRAASPITTRGSLKQTHPLIQWH